MLRGIGFAPKCPNLIQEDLVQGIQSCYPQQQNESRNNGYQMDKFGNQRSNIYRTRAIITRDLYLFYPIFHCGLYLRAVCTAERLVITWIFFHLRSPQKIKKEDSAGNDLLYKVQNPLKGCLVKKKNQQCLTKKLLHTNYKVFWLILYPIE